MTTLHRHIRDQLITALGQALKKVSLDNPSPYLQHWTLPPQKNMGHLCFPCFPLAKPLKKKPVHIAQELAQAIKPPELVEKICPNGPYLNFTFKMQTIAPLILHHIATGDFFKSPQDQKLPKTMIEYFQPNTHKTVHVGHLRNLSLGQAMVEMHRYLGYPVISATYPGDSGTHVAKVLWYLLEKKPAPPKGCDRGEWLGEIYAKTHALQQKKQKEEQGQEGRKELKTPSHLLKEISQESGESYELWKETRQWSIDHIKDICQWAEVEFDHWYFESELDAPSLALVKKLYEEGKLIKDDGAIVMDLKEEKLGLCLLLKRDGNGLYATKDIALAQKKFCDYGIEKNIYVVDKRQSLHFKQVFKTLEKIGYPQASQCYHLAYEFVELPGGAISSRSGRIISAQSFIHEMEKNIRENFLTKYPDWSEEKKQKVSKQVAQGAIKYGMTSVDNNKKIIFDMKSWLRLDGESGPYIQYTYARIQSLMKKSFPSKTILECDWSQLKHPLEQSLLIKLMNFNQVIENSCRQYKTSLFTTYLYELAKEFNSFYTQCPLKQAETEESQNLRGHLAHKTGSVLSCGLKLLGIPAPEQM